MALWCLEVKKNEKEKLQIHKAARFPQSLGEINRLVSLTEISVEMKVVVSH